MTDTLLQKCDFPEKGIFSFVDSPGEHNPCYVVMPGGAMLEFNHHAGDGVDVARARFIVGACNVRLATSPLDDEILSLVRVWRECKPERRPSAEALADRIVSVLTNGDRATPQGERT
jgi:hypothetical protein